MAILTRPRVEVASELAELSEGLIDGLTAVEGDTHPYPLTVARMRELLEEYERSAA